MYGSEFVKCENLYRTVTQVGKNLVGMKLQVKETSLIRRMNGERKSDEDEEAKCYLKTRLISRLFLSRM